MKTKTSNGGGLREIILGSAYLPYDDVEPPHPGELVRLVIRCMTEGTHLITAMMQMRITPAGEVQILTTEVSPCLITLWLMDWT